MTQRQFDASIKQLLDEYLDRAIARVKRLQQIKSGSRDVHRVRVREHVVPEHTVRAHWRLQPGRVADARALREAA
jgi:hypothetical protein